MYLLVKKDKCLELSKVVTKTLTVIQFYRFIDSMQRQVRTASIIYYWIACDESTDATDTVQLLIFLRGIDNFCITEGLLDLSSLKGTTTGKDMFEAVSDSIGKMGLQWEKLCGVTTAVKIFKGFMSNYCEQYISVCA